MAAHQSDNGTARRLHADGAAPPSPPRTSASSGWIGTTEGSASRPGGAAPFMTLGSAVEKLHVGPIACACAGHSMCCIWAYPQAERLKREAHIIAHLLTAVAARRAGVDLTERDED